MLGCLAADRADPRPRRESGAFLLSLLVKKVHEGREARRFDPFSLLLHLLSSPPHLAHARAQSRTGSYLKRIAAPSTHFVSSTTPVSRRRCLARRRTSVLVSPNRAIYTARLSDPPGGAFHSPRPANSNRKCLSQLPHHPCTDSVGCNTSSRTPRVAASRSSASLPIRSIAHGPSSSLPCEILPPCAPCTASLLVLGLAEPSYNAGPVAFLNSHLTFVLQYPCNTKIIPKRHC